MEPTLWQVEIVWEEYDPEDRNGQTYWIESLGKTSPFLPYLQKCLSMAMGKWEKPYYILGVFPVEDAFREATGQWRIPVRAYGTNAVTGEDIQVGPGDQVQARNLLESEMPWITAVVQKVLVPDFSTEPEAQWHPQEAWYVVKDTEKGTAWTVPGKFIRPVAAN